MTDLKEQAQQLIELNQKRTPGEWEVKRVHGKRFDVDACDMGRIVGFVCERSTSKNDPDFIAHTANHAPAIAQAYLDKCEEVERLREALLSITKTPVRNPDGGILQFDWEDAIFSARRIAREALEGKDD